jgi:hypothetical protein
MPSNVFETPSMMTWETTWIGELALTNRMHIFSMKYNILT